MTTASCIFASHFWPVKGHFPKTAKARFWASYVYLSYGRGDTFWHERIHSIRRTSQGSVLGGGVLCDRMFDIGAFLFSKLRKAKPNMRIIIKNKYYYTNIKTNKITKTIPRVFSVSLLYTSGNKSCKNTSITIYVGT